ncbi:MAG: hypothetical protein JXB50_11390 [Spirochaetes bacterium]|nr:hypothetical protein [Spirochaetota bacterium]
MKTNKLLIIFFILSSCAFLINAEKSSTGDNKKILILTSSSKYRQMLMQSVSKKLNEMSFAVTSDKMKNQKKYKSLDFDLVILISGVEAGNPYKDTYDFIINNNYNSNIIYFSALTDIEGAWGKKLEKKKIDAITAASNKKNIEEVTDKIIKKVNEKFNIKR